MIATLVLTAGLGTRLDPLTRLVAKAAVPLDDRTLVEHVLAGLSSQGVRNVVLNLHHRPASITSVVADGRHLGLRARYSWEHPLLGSAGGPRHALGLLASDPFLVVNGDTLCDVDIRALIAQHTRSRALVTMAVVPNPAPDQYNGIAVNDRDEITGFVPKGQADGTWHYVGYQVVQASVFASLADGVPAETVAGIYREMVMSAPGRICVFRLNKPFLDVGTPRDYLDTVWQVRGRSTSRAPAVSGPEIARSIIWPEARVAPGAHLDDCIVAGPVSVPERFTASGKVIVPASVATPGDRAEIAGDLAIFSI